MHYSSGKRSVAALVVVSVVLATSGCGSSDPEASLESIAADADDSISQLIAAVDTSSGSDKQSLLQLRAAASTTVDTLSDSIEDVDALLANAQSTAGESFRKALVSEREVAQSLSAAKLEADRIELASAKSALVLSSAAGPQLRVVDTSALVKSLNAASRKSRSATSSAPQSSSSTNSQREGQRTFYVGTGNISCSLSSEAAECSVASNQITFQVIGSSVGETEDGAKFGRANGTQVAYGTTVTVGDFTCEVPPQSVASGVNCRNNSTGHGFEASKVAARQKTF